MKRFKVKAIPFPTSQVDWKTLVATLMAFAAMVLSTQLTHAEQFSTRLETTYLTWRGDFGFRTHQFIEPDGTRSWRVSTTPNPRRIGLTGTFENGERVAAEKITIGTNVWFSCIFWDTPGDGDYSDGGAINPWNEEQQKAAVRKICDPNKPDAVINQPSPIATATQASSPAPSPSDKPGLCQLGRDSWGPAILEGSVDGRPTVIKLGLGKSLVLASGNCWILNSMAELNSGWEKHKAAFVTKHGASANVVLIE